MDDYKPSQNYQTLSKNDGQGLNIFDEHQFNIARFKEFESKLVQLDNNQLSIALDYFYNLRRTQRANGEDKYVDQEIVFDYIQILLSERAQRCNWISDGKAQIKHYFQLFSELNSKQLEYCFTQSGVPL